MSGEATGLTLDNSVFFAQARAPVKGAPVLEIRGASPRGVETFHINELQAQASDGFKQALVAAYIPATGKFEVARFLELSTREGKIQHAVPSLDQALAYLRDAKLGRLDPNDLINQLPHVAQADFETALFESVDARGHYAYPNEHDAFCGLTGYDKVKRSEQRQTIDAFFNTYGTNSESLVRLIADLQKKNVPEQTILRLATLVHGQLRMFTLVGFSNLNRTVREPERKWSGISSKFIKGIKPMRSNDELPAVKQARQKLGFSTTSGVVREPTSQPATQGDKSKETQPGVMCAGGTDRGRSDKRPVNEDNFFVSDDSNQGGVLDGVGGASAGEVASGIARDVCVQDTMDDIVTRLKAASAKIRLMKKKLSNNMDTTATVYSLHGDKVFIAHVGDSRGYLIRGQHIRQLTKDHSMVAEMVRKGIITPEEAETHPERNVITRSLGRDPDKIDVVEEHVQPEDVLLFCTDGLRAAGVTDAQIWQIVSEGQPASIIVQRLIDLANANGGPDNIAVVVRKI